MKVRIVRLFMSVFLIAALVAAPCAMAARKGYIETPTLDGSVFLRSGGSMSYPPIGYGNNDDSLNIHSINRYWDRVTITSGVGYGKTGWMYNGYIRLLRYRDDITSWGTMARVKDAYELKGVRLYRGPGSRYGYKRTLYPEDMLIVLKKYSSSWYKVQLGRTNSYGYVYKPRITNGVYASVYASAELHRRASLSSIILDVVEPGDSIIVLSIGSKWSKVKFGVFTGYVLNDYLNLDGDIDYDDEGEENDL